MGTVPTLRPNEPSTYMDFLPAVYRTGETPGQANFTGVFLKIYEKLLTGIRDNVALLEPQPDGSLRPVNVIGLEEVVSRLHDYFDPLFTPALFKTERDQAAFLAYLSSWVALMQNQTWDLASQRRLLATIVPLYKHRGTTGGLGQYLRIYLSEFTGSQVSIQENLDGIQVGVTGTIGQNTIVGGSPPYFFFVEIDATFLNGFAQFRNLVANTRAIVDLEKPAHTYYAFLYRVPGFVVGFTSTVGQDTMIGTPYGLFA